MVSRILMIPMTIISSTSENPFCFDSTCFMSAFLYVDDPLHRFQVALGNNRRWIAGRLAGHGGCHPPFIFVVKGIRQVDLLEAASGNLYEGLSLESRSWCLQPGDRKSVV